MVVMVPMVEFSLSPILRGSGVVRRNWSRKPKSLLILHLWAVRSPLVDEQTIETNSLSLCDAF